KTNEVVIGEIVSLTGLEASFGTSTRNGVSMAVDKINGEGGVRGRRLRVELMDDKGKPEEAVLAITKMIPQFSPTAVIGAVASSRSIAMAPVAQSQKVPMISPSSTHP